MTYTHRNTPLTIPNTDFIITPMRITNIIDRENPIARIITVRILQRYTPITIAPVVLDSLQQLLRPSRSDRLCRPLGERTCGSPTVDLLARGCGTGEASSYVTSYANKGTHGAGEAEGVAATIDAKGFAGFQKVSVCGWGGGGGGGEKKSERQKGGEGWNVHVGLCMLLWSVLIGGV